MVHQTKCNCCDCIWDRIKGNSETLMLETKRGRQLSYRVLKETIVWIPNEDTMNNLYPVSKEEICKSIKARLQNLNPGQYPGTAISYKYAILNSEKIWLE